MSKPSKKQVLHVDFETRSEADLKKVGAYVYATHPSTQIICMGWAFDDDEPQIWAPELSPKFPVEVIEHLTANEPRASHAHNAQFERLIVKYVLPIYAEFPQPDIDHWCCTAAQARARALPGALDDLGACLNLPIQKDKRGKELIRLLCIPHVDGNGDIGFNLDPHLLSEMYEYCKQDVRTERLAAQVTPPLTDVEHDDWVVSEMVNDAGLKVDVAFAEAATEYAAAEVAEISAKLTRVTSGKITSHRQHQRLKAFMAPYMEANDRVRNAMTVVKTDRRTGEEEAKTSFDRGARASLLSLEASHPGTLPDKVIRTIELVDEAGRSSVAKFKNMVNRAGCDGRVRGAYIFSGAGQTGRFSSVGLQVHNLPRECAKDPEALHKQVMGDKTLTNVMDDLASMLRPSIIASPKHTLVWGDWSAIEARVLPWLTNSLEGNDVLDVFGANDADPALPDIYIRAAGGFYDVQPEYIDKAQRQIGKVIILSSGYQGGYRAFQAMARAYRIEISDDEAGEIIRSWRAQNAWAVNFWCDLNSATINAMRHPGEVFYVGRLIYCRPDDVAPLYCQLPSGRMLAYPQPRLDLVEGVYGDEYKLTAVKAQWKPRRGETEWGRINLYGGLLAENATQATAADILRHSMGLTIEDGWPLVGTTHDELLLEVRDDEVSEAEEALEAVMLDMPVWAEGLPMAVEVSHGKRYAK
jgi:DNA polymerase bacteriophage-type